MLRKRIQELQAYRRLGLRSAGDIEKYDADLAKRVYPALIVLFPRFDFPDFSPKTHARATVTRDWFTSERIQRNGSGRQSSVTDTRGSEGPDSTPKPGGQTNGAPARKPGTLTSQEMKIRLPPVLFGSVACFSDVFRFFFLTFQRHP